jgi:hypothetical protein
MKHILTRSATWKTWCRLNRPESVGGRRRTPDLRRLALGRAVLRRSLRAELGRTAHGNREQRSETPRRRRPRRLRGLGRRSAQAAVRGRGRWGGGAVAARVVATRVAPRGATRGPSGTLHVFPLVCCTPVEGSACFQTKKECLDTCCKRSKTKFALDNPSFSTL